MPKYMKATSDPSDAEPFAYDFKITQDIPLGELTALLGTEDQTLFMGRQVPVQDLAKLNADWYDPMLIALSFDKKRKVVKVNILAGCAT